MKKCLGRSLVWLLVPIIAGCSHFALRWQHTSKGSPNWPFAGGDAGRSSAIAHELHLPLHEVSRFKLSSAVAQNIFVNDGILFVPTLDGRLFAISLAERKIIGRRKLPGGYPGTLAISKGALTVALRFGKETLHHHELATGHQVWDIDAGDIASEPLIADSLIFVNALYEHADAYSLRDGSRIWQFKTKGHIHASPSLAEGVLVVATSKGIVYGLSPDTGKELWQIDLKKPILATPAIDQGRVLVGTSSEIVALDLNSGKIIWRAHSEGRIFHPPAVHDSLAIFACSDGFIRALETATGKTRWQIQAGSSIGTSPLIAGDKVFFGALDGHFYCVNFTDGDLRWRQELEGRVRTNPIVWNQYVIVASEDRFLHIFGPEEQVETNGK